MYKISRINPFELLKQLTKRHVRYNLPVIELCSEDLQKKAKELDPGDGSLKLHLGCGTKHFKGFVNIDLNETNATDLVCSILRLPFCDNSAQLIETYHVIEHLPRHDLPIALKDWFRVLRPGGKLIMEYPDFDTTVKEYIAGNEKRIDNIFGLQRFPGDTHLFGYNFKRLEKILKECGYKNIISTEPTDYHKSEEPCQRIEAVKSEQT